MTKFDVDIHHINPDRSTRRLFKATVEGHGPHVAIAQVFEVLSAELPEGYRLRVLVTPHKKRTRRK